MTATIQRLTTMRIHSTLPDYITNISNYSIRFRKLIIPGETHTCEVMIKYKQKGTDKEMRTKFDEPFNIILPCV